VVIPQGRCGLPATNRVSAFVRLSPGGSTWRTAVSLTEMWCMYSRMTGLPPTGPAYRLVGHVISRFAVPCALCNRSGSKVFDGSATQCAGCGGFKEMSLACRDSSRTPNRPGRVPQYCDLGENRAGCLPVGGPRGSASGQAHVSWRRPPALVGVPSAQGRSHRRVVNLAAWPSLRTPMGDRVRITRSVGAAARSTTSQR
jgi:hypothetical protein